MRNDCLLVRLHVSPVGLKNSNDLTRPRIFCARITLAICLTRLGSRQAGKPKGKGLGESFNGSRRDACQDRNSVVPGTLHGRERQGPGRTLSRARSAARRREKGHVAEAAPWPGSKGIRVLFGRRVRLPDISRIKISQFC